MPSLVGLGRRPAEAERKSSVCFFLSIRPTLLSDKVRERKIANKPSEFSNNFDIFG